MRTNPKNDFKIGFPGLHWFHINGEVEQYRNVNMLEVEKCVELAEDLQNKFPEASIGIVTPFNDQKQELQKAFRNIKNDKVVVDTVHRFQGDEKISSSLVWWLVHKVEIHFIVSSTTILHTY